MSDPANAETYGGTLSLTKAAVAVGAVLALFFWGVAAADYARDTQGWTALGTPEEEGFDRKVGRLARRSAPMRASWRALTRWGWNGVVQIPRAPWVLGHTLTDRPWLAGLFVLLEGGVFGGALLFRKLDAELNAPPPSERRDRSRDRPAPRDRPRKPKRRPPPGYG